MNTNTLSINEQIISLRKEGLMQREIAENLSVTISKVNYVLEKANMKNYKYKRVCRNCGEHFETIIHAAKFCEERCRTNYNRANKGKEQVCKGCSKRFVSYAIQDYCEIDCKKRYSVNLKKIVTNANYVPRSKNIHDCIECGEKYETTSKTPNICSYKCRYIRRLRNKTKHNIKCKECSEWFTIMSSANKTKRLFCSKKCGNKFWDRKKETLRRKRIQSNGDIDWGISIERLIKRDKNTCYLCNESVDVSLDSNHDYYPSIEHVVPVSKGGTHTWDNVKLSHRICNSIKSDR